MIRTPSKIFILQEVETVGTTGFIHTAGNDLAVVAPGASNDILNKLSIALCLKAGSDSCWFLRQNLY
jgi:hypothetical protein